MHMEVLISGKWIPPREDAVAGRDSMITTYGYAHLALYIFVTEVMKINFWQLNENSRSLWIAGAIVVFLISVRSCRSKGLQWPGPWLH